MDRKKILVFIIVLLILIIFLLLTLININENNNTIGNNFVNNINNSLVNDNSIINNSFSNGITDDIPSNETQQDDDYTLEATQDYFDVKINSVYFTIKDKANDFFETINEGNTEKLYNILAKEYITKNNITKQNLKNIFSKYSNSKLHVEKIIEKIEENNICIFIVYGTINEREEYNMAIITDETNLNYCIYPYDYLKINGLNNFNVSSISENSYNNLVYKDVNKEELSRYHFEDYKYYAQNNPEELYKKLDSEYSKKRFGSLEEFKKYIKENKDRIENSILKSYKVIKNDGTTQYNCIDNYGNYYIFEEKTTMQYTVMLDNYTIMTEDEKAYYDGLDISEKAKYNMEKFINMVNTKDYNTIYNVLDNTFKTNNFKDVNSLKEHIEKNMFDINSIEIEDYDEEEEYYVFGCKVINQMNEDETINITVILKQSEGNDFTMSFSFSEVQE